MRSVEYYKIFPWIFKKKCVVCKERVVRRRIWEFKLSKPKGYTGHICTVCANSHNDAHRIAATWLHFHETGTFYGNP